MGNCNSLIEMSGILGVLKTERLPEMTATLHIHYREMERLKIITVLNKATQLWSGRREKQSAQEETDPPCSHWFINSVDGSVIVAIRHKGDRAHHEVYDS